jgi:hypothetical protein
MHMYIMHMYICMYLLHMYNRHTIHIFITQHQQFKCSENDFLTIHSICANLSRPQSKWLILFYFIFNKRLLKFTSYGGATI